MTAKQFIPRPDQPERFDEQTGYLESNLRGLAIMHGGNGSGNTAVSCEKVARFLQSCPPPEANAGFDIISEYEELPEIWRLLKSKILHSEIQWEQTRWHDFRKTFPQSLTIKSNGPFGDSWSLNFLSPFSSKSPRSIAGFFINNQVDWGVVEETLVRCRRFDLHGSKMYACTPIDKQQSLPLAKLWCENRIPEGFRIFRANTEVAAEAGHVSQHWFNEFSKMFDGEERNTRLTGAFRE